MDFRKENMDQKSIDDAQRIVDLLERLEYLSKSVFQKCKNIAAKLGKK